MNAKPGTETCWTMVRRAQHGDPDACSDLARTYLGIVRGFLRHRWGGSPMLAHLEDALQEVFLELFRRGGALERIDPERGNNFRPFLFGVAHNVARRCESRWSREPFEEMEDGVERADTTISPSRNFDRSWAQELLMRARDRQERAAVDAAARARVELLTLRFRDDLPIREIAARWNADAVHVHREYARARAEFKRALRKEVAAYVVGAPGEIEHECEVLLALLRGD